MLYRLQYKYTNHTKKKKILYTSLTSSKIQKNVTNLEEVLKKNLEEALYWLFKASLLNSEKKKKT